MRICCLSQDNVRSGAFVVDHQEQLQEVGHSSRIPNCCSGQFFKDDLGVEQVVFEVEGLLELQIRKLQSDQTQGKEISFERVDFVEELLELFGVLREGESPKKFWGKVVFPFVEHQIEIVGNGRKGRRVYHFEQISNMQEALGTQIVVDYALGFELSQSLFQEKATSTELLSQVNRSCS